MTFLADLSQILTGIIALSSAGWYFLAGYCRIRKLNSYLRDAKALDTASGKKGQHTAEHLMARLGMSEEQLYRASFWSCHVSHYLQSENGMASRILFGYKD